MKQVVDDTRLKITNSADKVLKICDNLRALQYPDIEELQEKISKEFKGVLSVFNDFFEERNILDFIAKPWEDKNLVCDLVEKIVKDGRCMASVTQEEIYQVCEEGEKRFNSKNPIPPGFKDAKNKDGVRKYSDLILWKEVMSYAKENSVDVLFVTDDLKCDWWEEENGRKIFHPYLVNEFEKITGRKIISYCALDFFEEVSAAYQIERTDAVEIALRITDDKYFERVNDAVFNRILDTLVYSGDEYIGPSYCIGSNGIDELEIIEQNFISAEQVHRDQDTIIYVFKYQVTAEATSYDYCGRDEDTKEIELLPMYFHTFEGEIEVKVVREADMYLDFEADDGFESADIISGFLEETNCEPLFETYEELEGAYNLCPACGREINFENDGGNGFCINCAADH